MMLTIIITDPSGEEDESSMTGPVPETEGIPNQMTEETLTKEATPMIETNSTKTLRIKADETAETEGGILEVLKKKM